MYGLNFSKDMLFSTKILSTNNSYENEIKRIIQILKDDTELKNMIQNLSPINKDRTRYVLAMMTTISHLIQKKGMG